MKLVLKDASGSYEAEVKLTNSSVIVKTAGGSSDIEYTVRSATEFILADTGQIHRAYAVRRKDDLYFHLNGRNWNFKDVSETGGKTAALAAGDGDNRVVAPMPGSVIKLLVEAGAKVSRNQPLVIVEAMKMENEVRAAMDGIVAKVLVSAGKQVGYGELLLELTPLEAGDAKAG